MTEKELIMFINDKGVTDKDISDFSSSVSLEKNGLDSFDIMMIMFELQEEYDVNLSNITKTNSIKDIIEVINDKHNEE